MLYPAPKSTPLRLCSGWEFACREPLVNFAVGGGLLFLAYWFWAAPAADPVVFPEMAQAMVKEQSRLLGRSLTAVERRAVMADYVNEEVLVREPTSRVSTVRIRRSASDWPTRCDSCSAESLQP